MYNMQSTQDSFYQDNVSAGMMGHMPRFYPSHMQMPAAVQNNNPFRSLSRLSEDMRFDLNRNSVHDRQFYQNKLPKYYAEPKLTNKSSQVMRNSINRSLYSPYPPPMPPPNYFKTSPLEQNNYNQEPMVGDYCVELLNRDKHYWTDEETGLMLELYEENREYFNDSKTKKTKIWSIIADMVNKRFSTCVNAEQCSQKFRNLKAEFLKVSDPTLVDGGAKKFGRHFQQMKRLLEDEEKRAVTRSCDEKQNAMTGDDKQENFDSGKLENTKSVNIYNSPTSSPEVIAPVKTPHLPVSPKATPTAPKISPSPPPNANYLPHDQKQYKSKAEILLECLINSTLSDINKADCDKANKSDETLPMKSEIETAEEKHLPESEFIDVESVNENQSQGGSSTSNIKVKTNDRYQTELRSIFDDYFVSRGKAVENFENNEKRNIVCMNKCIEVFRSVVRENILK
ncbi:uncharacterized protein LOC100202089 isoform X1 [Hydra vulgaris]|uniref:uncharacterized protein LOC100202089 isoform X1 n=2 Tax=Hydra vulgaris TaxID=6087 RepID=UPI0002B4D62E|nr:uncharacterized protein LOC100202089 isoform X1 [Hydra vulgaris]